MRLRAGLLWIAFAAFIAYLSFVPFRFQPLGFDEALARFAQIRYLDLGAGNRADWVANILMFVPLGWLAAAVFVPHPRGRFDLAAVIPSLIVGAAWAVAVEFGQVFFSGRTVSINDILAEVIGTLLGASLWSAFGARSRQWWLALLQGGHVTANAVLGGYLFAYLVLSLSPFDFVISAEELAHKAASNLHGWWMAPVSCGPTPCAVKLLVETAAVLPFGWWLATRRHGGGLLGAALLGAALGLLIELAQFVLVSGTSQGASVLSRAVGVALGAQLHELRHRVLAIDWARWGRPLVLAALLPYLAAVAYVAGWFGNRWLGLDAGLARAGQIQWLPFFYQYFSTEQALIRSTLVHLFLYAPVGVGVWLWGRRNGSASGWVAALLAAALALVAESGKLFVRGKHPDFTDVLFAVVAAWTAATLLRWASSKTRGITPPPGARPVQLRSSGRVDDRAAAASTANPGTDAGAVEDAAIGGAGAGDTAASWPARLCGAAALVVVAVSLARFPVAQVLLAGGLAAYAWLLTRRPLAYLIVVPMALPVLDLAPLSGRFFWDEFDFLLSTTLGIRLLMSVPQRRAASLLPRAGTWLLGLSVLASATVALWPPAPLDGNAFTSYLSPYNALRIAKGYLWGGALLWLIAHDAMAAGRQVGARLQVGLGLGLLTASLGVLWERLLFVGLADVGAWFRAAGSVSSTHIGGAHLEAMLVVLTPFALAQAATSRRLAPLVLWLGVGVLGAAAVLMTLSRAAAAAWVVVVAAFALSWWLGKRGPQSVRSRRRRAGLAVAVTFGLVAIAALMAQSTHLRGRLEQSGADLPVRLAHWRSALDLVRSDPLHAVAGMGLGSFPREFYLGHAAQQKLPAYRLGRDRETGRTFLSLSGGRGMYIDQRIGATPGRELLLRGQLRASGEPAGVSMALCEKSFLTSVRCDWTSVRAATDWQPFEVRLKLATAPGAGSWPRPPVSLSLHNSAFGSRVDIAQLSLLDGSSELLANGAFEHGLDHWLMFSDEHLAWRVKNTALQVAFEQGLLGMLAWLVLAAGFAALVLRRAGEPLVAAAIAAALGFLAVGLFDTLLDAPRLVVLATLVLACGSVAARLGQSQAREANADPRDRDGP
jgi:VanZ family protein